MPSTSSVPSPFAGRGTVIRMPATRLSCLWGDNRDCSGLPVAEAASVIRSTCRRQRDRPVRLSSQPARDEGSPQGAVAAALARQPDEASALQRRRQLRELHSPAPHERRDDVGDAVVDPGLSDAAIERPPPGCSDSNHSTADGPKDSNAEYRHVRPNNMLGSRRSAICVPSATAHIWDPSRGSRSEQAPAGSRH